MSQDNEALARQYFQEADRGRTPSELLAADFTAHFPGLPEMDEEAYDRFETMLRSAFSDIHHPIDDVLADGDRVAVRLRLEGTHTGEFMGVPPSGRPFSAEGTAFLHVSGGRVTRFWGFLDQFGLLRQIGGLPAPDQPA